MGLNNLARAKRERKKTKEASCCLLIFRIGLEKERKRMSKTHVIDSDVFGSYWENIDFRYRLLISFLRVIIPSDCDLKYHFGPKV